MTTRGSGHPIRGPLIVVVTVSAVVLAVVPSAAAVGDPSPAPTVHADPVPAPLVALPSLAAPPPAAPSTAPPPAAPQAVAAPAPVARTPDLPRVTTTAKPGTSAAAAIAFAMAQRGLPYVWGGDGPQRGETGFDCSGLTTAAYDWAGVELPRTAHTQYYEGPHVPAGAPLEPGDLVFYGVPERVHHVGLHLGDGRMINAPTFGKPVRLAYVRYPGDDYLGATRPAAGRDAPGLLREPDLPVEVPPVPAPEVPPAPTEFPAPPAPDPTPQASAPDTTAAGDTAAGETDVLAAGPDARVGGGSTEGTPDGGREPTVAPTEAPAQDVAPEADGGPPNTAGSPAASGPPGNAATASGSVATSTEPPSSTATADPTAASDGGATAPAGPAEPTVAPPAPVELAAPGPAEPTTAPADPASSGSAEGSQAPPAAAPPESTPPESTPAESTPAESTPAESTPAGFTPAAPAASGSVPGESGSAESGPAAASGSVTPTTSGSGPAASSETAAQASPADAPTSIALPGGENLRLVPAERGEDGLPTAPSAPGVASSGRRMGDAGETIAAVVGPGTDLGALAEDSALVLTGADGTTTELTVRSLRTVDTDTAAGIARAVGDGSRLVLLSAAEDGSVLVAVAS